MRLVRFQQYLKPPACLIAACDSLRGSFDLTSLALHWFIDLTGSMDPLQLVDGVRECVCVCGDLFHCPHRYAKLQYVRMPAHMHGRHELVTSVPGKM